MSQQSNYFKNRGDENGKKFAKGIEAAERDGYKFVAKTALALGAKKENVERLADAIKEDQRVKYLGISGYLYLIESDSTEMIGYCGALREHQNAIDDQKWSLQEDEYRG